MKQLARYNIPSPSIARRGASRTDALAALRVD
jgi:hypothetical protein